MTAIAFHVHLADPTAYACRLLRKAALGGRRVAVTGRPEQLRALDTALWTFSAPDFLPHGQLGALAPPALARTPIVLAPSPGGLADREVLVNLGDEVPEAFERFGRVIELVSAQPADLQQARLRWKHYEGLGHALTRFDQKDVTP